MKKMNLAAILIVSAMAFSACGSSANKETSAPESSVSTESVKEETKESEEETMSNGAQFIKPLQNTDLLGEKVPDGAYLVKIDVNSLKADGDKQTIHTEFFDCDRFDSKQIDAIKAADQIRVCGADIEVQGVELKVDENNAVKIAKINGGAEEGGVSLVQTENFYCAQNADGKPLLYSLGSTDMALSKDVQYMDFSDLNKPAGTTYEADQLSEALKAQKDAAWGPDTVSVIVKEHEISKIFRTAAK